MHSWSMKVVVRIRAHAPRFVKGACIVMLALLLWPAAARVSHWLADPGNPDSAGVVVAAGPQCGNGEVEPGEQCDDWNAVGGDCCSATCQFEAVGSECSDRNPCTNGDACDGAGNCVGPEPVICQPLNDCQIAHECDPSTGCVDTPKPNGTPCNDGDACTIGDQCSNSECVGTVPTCGDGVIESSCEQCDDGNAQSGDGCDAMCKLERDAQDCQQVIGQMGYMLLARRLLPIQLCRNDLNAGKELFFDRERTQPLTDPADCPSEAKVAASLPSTGLRLHSRLTRRCTDALVGVLGSCADTIDGLIDESGTGGCLVVTHAAAVDAAIAQEYGPPLAPEDVALRSCQEAIAEAGKIYLIGFLRAVQTCRLRLLAEKRLFFDKAKTQPLTDPADCPNAFGLLGSVVSRGETARAKVAKACTDTLLSSLGLCAATVDELVSPDGKGGCLLTGLAAQAQVAAEGEF